MKQYVKPQCTYVELKAEERLAASLCACNGAQKVPAFTNPYVHN